MVGLQIRWPLELVSIGQNNEHILRGNCNIGDKNFCWCNWGNEFIHTQTWEGPPFAVGIIIIDIC